MSTTIRERATDLDGDVIKAIPKRQTWHVVLTLVFLVALAMLVKSLITNPNWRWGTVGEYLFDPRIIAGLLNTLLLTSIAMTIGIVIGVVVAVLGQSGVRVLQTVAWGYTWFFRGTPVFVQIIFWYNISALYPEFTIAIPFGPELFSASANQIVTPFAAAILALSLNEGAYMSEVIRGGLLAVDAGQTEAAQSLGMRRLMALRRIVLPQAIRVIIPPTGNQVINMLKVTSLVSVIAFTELLYSAQLIYASNYKTIPLLTVASLWYLLCTSVLSVGQYFLERRLQHGPRTSGSQRKAIADLKEPA